MAESIIFVLIGGVLTILLVFSLGLFQWISPIWVVFFFFALLIPGFWGAFTTGPYVPTGRKRRESMLRLANLQPTDVVYELGCGDGNMIFTAAKTVRKAVGYEISIPLVLFAKIRKCLTRNKAEVYLGSIWNQNYRDADVLFCYLMPNAMKRLYQKIWPTLKPGTRVVTHAFKIHALKPIAQEEGVYVYQV